MSPRGSDPMVVAAFTCLLVVALIVGAVLYAAVSR